MESWPIDYKKISIKCFYYRRQEEYRKITKCTEETSKPRTWLKHDKWFLKKKCGEKHLTSTIALMPRNLAMSPSSALMSRPRRCLSASMRSWQGNDEKDWLHMSCSYAAMISYAYWSHRSWILIFTTWINDSMIKAGIDACFVLCKLLHSSSTLQILWRERTNGLPCNAFLGHIEPCSAHDLWRSMRKTQVCQNKRYGTPAECTFESGRIQRI